MYQLVKNIYTCPAGKFPVRLIRTWLEHSLELKGYALRIENMPIPVKRGSNKPAQRKGSQVTRRVARKWIGRAHAGTWGRAWLPAQAPGRSRTMGFCEQLFSAVFGRRSAKLPRVLFSRAITPLSKGLWRGVGEPLFSPNQKGIGTHY